jgi:hypothetical protein
MRQRHFSISSEHFYFLRTTAATRQSLFARVRTYPAVAIKTAFLAGGGANSGAPDARRKFHDPDLSQIITAWPTLPEHVKSAIPKMITESLPSAHI